MLQLSTTWFGCSAPRVVAATATILLTTLDDCVWLVPFVVHAPNRAIAGEHACLFAATLIGLTLLVSLGTALLQQQLLHLGTGGGSGSGDTKFDLVWSAAGAVLCWSLAAYFYYRSWRKKQRRQQEAAERQKRDQAEAGASDGLLAATATTTTTSSSEYGTANNNNNNDGGVDSMATTIAAQPWTVISLTVMGALDEVSYFPALIVGKVFTVTELVLGTVLTVIIMLFVVIKCLSQCRPLMDLLDRIPLYAVVTVFAVLLTTEVVRDVVTGGDD